MQLHGRRKETPSERKSFASAAATLAPYWLANEAPQVLPAIADRAPMPAPPGRFLLSLNSRPLAWTDPHGASIDWIDE